MKKQTTTRTNAAGHKIRCASLVSLAHLVTLLRRNLSSYCELWAWLDRPVATPPHVRSETQLALDLDSIPAAG